jgi:hypothetical protein
MTNVFLAFPDVSHTSDILSHTAEETPFIAENVVLSGRDTRFKTSANVLISEIIWDAGVGNTAKPEFMILTEVHKFLKKQVVSSDMDINFDGDDNSSFTTPENEGAVVDLTDLVGPNTEDYFLDLTAGILTSERYHRVKLDTNSDSMQHVWGKVYFGTMFDFGRDPTSISDYKISRGRSQIRKFSLKWSGITDAKRESFRSTLETIRPYAGLFIHDPNDCILYGNKLLHVQVEGVFWETAWVDSNTVTIQFREIL